MVKNKALYGLRNSGGRWYYQFADTRLDMGYTLCKADPDIWIKGCNRHYDKVCVYVDDLMFIGKQPQWFLTKLTTMDIR